ncbi:hypothetical protein GGF41_002776 [Coemansia sp. RSA 2531]|nr:hypothetical protein GGF41_002776 [Coemansia sp. RSA 2531]
MSPQQEQTDIMSVSTRDELNNFVCKNKNVVIVTATNEVHETMKQAKNYDGVDNVANDSNCLDVLDKVINLARKIASEHNFNLISYSKDEDGTFKMTYDSEYVSVLNMSATSCKVIGISACGPFAKNLSDAGYFGTFSK